jgi:hypothetical protein
MMGKCCVLIPLRYEVVSSPIMQKGGQIIFGFCELTCCLRVKQDHKGEEITINVTKTVLYMLDYDIVKLLPTLYDDFISCFKLRGALPGGSHCMMNSVTSNGRPFM